MNDVEGDDSAEEEEDSNEVDEENDAQSHNAECDDANSGNDEEENNQVKANKNKPANYPSKKSCVYQTPNDWISLVSCLV